MNTGRKDIFWNYLATFMRIASGIIILPLVLRLLPSQEVGLWSIFLTVSSLTALMDFGFSNSFSRNVAYVFSGVDELKVHGYKIVESKNEHINFSLLKSVIKAMRTYYGLMSLLFLILFYLVSPYYLGTILEKYSGEKTEIWIAWFTYGTLVAYEFYTYYYNSLMTGRGLIKKNMQIIVFSQSLRIIATLVLLLSGFGIISLVLGILISDVVNRVLSYKVFFDKEIRDGIKGAIAMPVKDVMKIMTPNAFKIGLTTLGYFALNQAITMISPFYLSLAEVAEYGISKQVISLIMSLGGTWFGTFYPQLTQYRVRNDIESVKRLYIKGLLVVLFVFIVTGVGLLLLGNPLLHLIHSKTFLLGTGYLMLMLVFGFLDSCQSISTSTLLTKNEVPFFKSVLISGLVSLVVLMIMLRYFHLGVLAMILAPGITMTAYQNWKWPLETIKESNIKIKDFISIIKKFSIK
ncbi:MAG: O-unit flippase-like protein [Paludibacter sp.]|nr:O-unit flippase-like protein [Paludibacter sp.]